MELRRTTYSYIRPGLGSLGRFLRGLVLTKLLNLQTPYVHTLYENLCCSLVASNGCWPLVRRNAGTISSSASRHIAYCIFTYMSGDMQCSCLRVYGTRVGNSKILPTPQCKDGAGQYIRHITVCTVICTQSGIYV